MKNKKLLFVAFALLLLVTSASTAEAFSSHTARSFIELLLQQGIIAPQNEAQARKNLESLENESGISVEATQYIARGARTYNTFETIDGLLLKVTNTSDVSKILFAKRGCQVTYRIFDGAGTQLYDNSSVKRCQSTEKVQYSLAPQKSRLFEVEHTYSTYPLKKGVYTFEIEYPAYGKDTVEVTVE